ncbi:MAG: pyrimidine 5'-nucleotidase [Anaerolineales bacterium]|nr:pyrimidine 5'-nucleotidase [Anaerolineales bacterium]
MNFSTLLIDLDDTLYPNTNGVWETIRERMTDFMLDRLNLPIDVVNQLRRDYFETYGTTLRGLQIHYQIDADEYLAYVHDLPLEDYLAPDPAIQTLLGSLPQQKWVFTNADDAHAHRVLSILELTDFFKGIIDVRALDYACKPQLDAYKRALKISGETNPQRCLMLDDSIRNLIPATKMGITTILVGTNDPHPDAHHSIPSLHHLPDVMPELWKNENNGSKI